MNKEDKLLEALNGMIDQCEPFTYEQLNVLLKGKVQEDDLIAFEELNPEIGLAKHNDSWRNTSTLALIATITDILVGKRLAFKMNEAHIITGVTWVEECKK